jgi:hypothetical protein
VESENGVNLTGIRSSARPRLPGRNLAEHGMSCSASSIAESLNAKLCCMKWMRSMVSGENGGRR